MKNYYKRLIDNKIKQRYTEKRKLPINGNNLKRIES